MTSVPAFVERALRRISSPSEPPMRWPAMTRSNTCFSIFSRASLPDWATLTLYPLRLIDWTRPSRRDLSSSATRMFFIRPAPPRGSCWKTRSIQRVNINFEDRESRKAGAFFSAILLPRRRRAPDLVRRLTRVSRDSGRPLANRRGRAGRRRRGAIDGARDSAPFGEKQRQEALDSGKGGAGGAAEAADLVTRLV